MTLPTETALPAETAVQAASAVPADRALEDPPLLHVRRMGRARDGAVPVVMLHGAVTGSLASWWMTCAPKVARSNPVVLYDLRGHGLSQRPATGYRLGDHLADLARVTSDLASFALVGHSLGGLIAIEAARAWPDRVAALVGVDVPLGPNRPTLNLETVTQQSAAAQGPAGSATRAGGTLRRSRHHDLPLGETTFRADLANEPPLDAAALASVRCPTMMAFGRQSPFVDGADIARAALGEGAVRLFDGGHALHVDATDALSAAMCEFLAGATVRPQESAHG